MNTVINNNQTIEYQMILDLRDEVADLRQQLDDHRKELATEVRTRRLVVVDEAGREVIHTNILKHAAQFTVEWPHEDRDHEDPRHEGTRRSYVLLQADTEGEVCGGQSHIYMGSDEVMGVALHAESVIRDKHRVVRGSLDARRSTGDAAGREMPTLERVVSVRPASIDALGRDYTDLRGTVRFEVTP